MGYRQSEAGAEPHGFAREEPVDTSKQRSLANEVSAEEEFKDPQIITGRSVNVAQLSKKATKYDPALVFTIVERERPGGIGYKVRPAFVDVEYRNIADAVSSAVQLLSV